MAAGDGSAHWGSPRSLPSLLILPPPDPVVALLERAMADGRIDSWEIDYETGRCWTWVQVRKGWRASKVRISDEQVRRASVDIIGWAVESAIRELDRPRKLDVARAQELFGFRDGELKAVHVDGCDERGVHVHCELVDSDWEPEFLVAHRDFFLTRPLDPAAWRA